MTGVQKVITVKDQTGGISTVFDDVNPTDMNTEDLAMLPLRRFKDMSDGVSTYLSRALNIANFTWTSTTTGQFLVVDPWSYVATNVSTRDKVKNFSTMKGKLHIRIVTNGTQFHYGRAIVSYVPFYSLQSAVYKAKYLVTPLIFQVQNVEINPTTSKPVEMVLDMFTDVDSIGLQGQTTISLSDMGSLLFTVLTPLQSANVATPDPITIQVYAWFDEPSLGVPTPNTSVLQAGDEMTNTGPISKVASAVAGAASYFKNIPIIGRFATATEIGAQAVGGIASLFGYSNPVTLNRDQLFKSTSASNYCQIVGKDSSKIFSMDPLRQLTIDPKSVGFPDRDEMSFAFLYTIPFYMRGINWTTVAAPGTLLAVIGVSPCATWQTVPGAGLVNHHLAPIQLLSKMAECWTGALKYRFKVVCSPYHKGRLLFRYHPYRTGSAIVGYGDVTSQSVIFDIGLNSEKELIVDWSRPSMWLPTGMAFAPPDSNQNSNTSAGGSTTSCPDYCNGEISIEVLTELTAPIASAPVTIHVFVEGTESLRFSNWNMGALATPGTAIVQAGPDIEMSMGEVKSTTLGMGSMFPEQLNRVTVGENVASLRALLRRTYPLGIKYQAPSSGLNITNGNVLVSSNYPLVLPQTTAITQVCETPYQHPLQVWRNAYAASKGSIRYKIDRYNRSGGTLQNTNLSRIYGSAATVTTTNILATGLGGPLTQFTNYERVNGWAQLGAAESLVEFEVYDTNIKKYRLATFNEGPQDAVRLVDYFVNYTDTTLNGDKVLYSVVAATGEDHTFLYFTGMPIIQTGVGGWSVIGLVNRVP